MAVFAVGIFTIVVALLRLSIIAQEIVTYNLNDVTWFTAKFSWTIMDPAVGCFVSCMPTWTPLAKPLQRLPTLFTSLRNLTTRSRSRSSKMNTMLPGESGEFRLPEYGQGNAKAVTTTFIGIPSELPTTMPQPGKVMVRRDLSQTENGRASDDALL
ncbi:MAG: hypothetical protein M1821_007583 [Bathelium mastoideum]|nr:MAG: hypothetical protein M1821_007583 [Bathelium mastoideum]KAI9677941.1 MAG: hypothetical protein M1822_008049 [Bathelium mastoideum]